MFKIVATSHPQYNLRLLAEQVGGVGKPNLIRIIDVALKIVYPPTGKEAFLRRSPGWFPLERFDEPTNLPEFLAAHPEIQDLETEEKFRQWQRDNSRSQEPPVDSNNTLGALIREANAHGYYTREEISEYARQETQRRRAEYRARMAKKSANNTTQEESWVVFS